MKHCVDRRKCRFVDLYRRQWKIIIDYLVYKDSHTSIVQFRRPPLAPKGAQILKDAEFAITCKKVDLPGSSTTKASILLFAPMT